MRIFVFGANGMLGRYVGEYFKNATLITRQEFNALALRREMFIRQLNNIGVRCGDVVINCIGITNKQNREHWEFLAVNSVFPRLLADYCETNGIRLIHISTDCVFSGDTGFYSEWSSHDEEGIYGISKSLGESLNATVIRTSIIGENPRNSLDLLEWVRSQSGKIITGWENHFWNGITCWQFAKVCDTIIKEKLFWEGVRHIHTDSICKADLIEIINDVYSCGCTINRTKAEIPCNRVLISDYSDVWDFPTIRQQIIEQKNYIR